MIYLDNSATTPLWPEVSEAMQPWLRANYGNPSSIHELGRTARVALEEAREVVARLINARPSEVVFTASGTEANNTALKGWAFHHALHGKPFSALQLLNSAAEHHAILEPAAFLEQLGLKRTVLPVDDDGIVSPRVIDHAIPESLVSLMLVNNEVGSMNPVAEVAQRMHAKGGLVHTDAVQALGKITIDLHALEVDLATFSAHKIHGPKGIGALFIKSGTLIEPLIHGGAQERNRRGGTESVALAVGFAEAAKLTEEKRIREGARLEELGRWLRASLEAIDSVIINSPLTNWLPSILNFSFTEELLPKIDGETLIMRFDLEGIAVSNGAACTSGSVQPSHVLLAMNKGSRIAGASVRVSLSYQNTKEELQRFVEVLKSIIDR